MRKIIFLVLIFVLTFAFVDSSLAEAAWENLPQGQAVAYFDELSYLVKTKGIAPRGKDGYTEGLGVAYARLLDFDGDGSPELYVVINEKNPDELYYDEMARQKIWSWEDGQLKLVHDDSMGFVGTRVSLSSGILKGGNKVYLTYGESYSINGFLDGIYGEETYEKIFELNDGKFIEKTAILESALDYHSKEHSFEVSGQYPDYPDSYQGKTIYTASYIEDGKEVVTDKKLYDMGANIDLDQDRHILKYKEKFGKINEGVSGIYSNTAISKLGDVNSLLKILENASKIGIHAEPTSSKILVNGKAMDFDAYRINDNNYFKLRDLAKAINGTSKKFQVTWDLSKNAINLTSNSPYTSVGGELAKGDNDAKNAKLTKSTIYKDGVEVELTAYTIGGNNFFKLRDIAEAFDIGVTWDDASKTIGIDTNIGYTED